MESHVSLLKQAPNVSVNFPTFKKKKKKKVEEFVLSNRTLTRTVSKFKKKKRKAALNF